MGARQIGYIAVGFGLLFVAHSVGELGDAAPLNTGGVSPERLQYHLAALLLDVGAIVCFVAALVGWWRGRRAR
jgi:hypothetical protein